MLARWMGAAELGVYVLAFSWCILLATVSHLGFASATLRVIGQALGQANPGLIWGFLSRGYRIIVATSLVTAVTGGVVVFLLRRSLPGSDAAPFLLAVASVPILALISFQCAVALAFRWLRLSFLLTEVVRPIALFVIVAAIWVATEKLTAGSVMSVQMVLMFGTALALYVGLRQRLGAEVIAAPPVFETRLWVRTALPLLVISLFGNYFPEFMLILLGPQVASDQVAIFNASYRLALLVAFGLNAIDAVTAPVAARLFAARERTELQAVVTRATHLGFWSSLAAVAGFAAFGPWLLGLFGPEFVVGHETMMILAAAQLLRSAAGPVMSLLSVTGHQDRCLVVFGSALIASVLLIITLVPAFGIRGAAASVLLVTLGWSVWLHRLVVVHLGIRPSIFGVLARD